MSAVCGTQERRTEKARPGGDHEFQISSEQSHHLYDGQRLQYLKVLARPVIGTLFVAAFATVVFKSPPPVPGEAPALSAPGAGAIEPHQADRTESQLDPLLLRLEPGSDQHG
jgi:hypothetical protein